MRIRTVNSKKAIALIQMIFLIISGLRDKAFKKCFKGFGLDLGTSLHKCRGRRSNRFETKIRQQFMRQRSVFHKQQRLENILRLEFPFAGKILFGRNEIFVPLRADYVDDIP